VKHKLQLNHVLYHAQYTFNIATCLTKLDATLCKFLRHLVKNQSPLIAGCLYNSI